MRKFTFQHLMKSFMIFMLMFSAMESKAQQPYECIIQNITLTAPNILEFDVYIKNTGTASLKLNGFQAGIDFNYIGMAGGGTITGAFVAGSNSLPAPQNAPNWNINATSKQIRMLAALVTNSSNAVSLTSTPVMMGKFRMTNTVPFTTCATPNFSWSFITAANKTKTAVTTWVNGATSPVSITDPTHPAATYANGGGPQHYVSSNLAVSCNTPILNLNGTLTGMSSCVGSASPTKSFTVSGTLLTASVSVVASTGFEVTLDTTTTFADSIVLNHTAGTLASTTVYARMKSTATGTPTGTIVARSSGAAQQTLNSGGTVNAAATISSFTPSGAPVGSLVTVNGTSLNGLTALNIGGVPAVPVSVSSNTIVGMVMPGATTGPISVNSNGCITVSSTNFTVTSSQVPNSQQGLKLVGTGGIGPNINQGTSVAISADGNTAVVGAYTDSASRGAAWIFTRNGNTWSQQGGKLVGTGFVGNSNQGRSVAISADGNTVLVGGMYDNLNQGAVWVFTRTGNTWSQQGNKLVGTGSAGTANQGWSVALSADGNTAIVGGPSDSSYRGASWIFTRSGNTWSQQGNKLVGSALVGSSSQGQSVSLSADGNTAMVGGKGDNFNQGAAWVFTRNGNTWSQQGSKLVGTGNTGSANQGNSVSLSADGNTAIIGGPSDNVSNGAAWIFTRSGNTWSQQGNKLVGTGNVGTANQAANATISADGNTVAFGGVFDDSFAGAVWVFARNGSTWSQQGTKLLGTGAMGKARQGSSLSISADGNTLISGGLSDSNNIGASWIFVNGAGLSATGNLTAFSTCEGTASNSQSFSINGIGLSSFVSIIAPAGYEVSLSSGSGYADSLGINPAGGSLALTSIYVRLKSTPTGTPAGNIVVKSAGVSNVNVAVTGTVNASPTVSVSNSTSQSTATDFNLNYSNATGTPNQYSIATASPNALSGFTAVNNATLGSSPINVPIPASAAGTYNFTFTVKNSSTGCSSIAMPFTLTISTPTISSNGTLSAFTTCAGTPSAEQSFSVSGSNLNAALTITPPANFEVSTTSGSGFQSSVILSHTAGNVSATTIYIRLKSTASGAPSGNITCTSTGATPQNIAITGTANALPTITTGSVSSILSTATSFNLPYTATTGSPNQYSISTGTPNAMTGFSAVSNASLGSSPIAVIIPASAAGTYNFNLTVKNTTTGCVSTSVPFTVNIGAPASNIAVNGSLSAFSACAGSASAQQSFSVSGSFLSGNITITPPAGFEVSTTSGSGFAGSVVLTPSSGSVASTTIYVRMSSSATGTPSGNITCTSAGATTQSVSTSGTVNALPGITLGSVNSVITTSTSFNLPYSATTGSPDQYSITTGSPNAMSGFTAVSNATITTSPLTVPIPASAAGTYNFILTVRNSSSNCTSVTVPFTVTVGAPAANINTSGTLASFTTCAGTASAEQSFSVSGNYLSASINIVPPAGYEVSASSGSGFGASLTLPQTGGIVTSTTVYVRLSSSASGTPGGNILCMSAGATTQNVSASGSVNAQPTITLGSITSVATNATSFNLPYSASTGSPDQYSIAVGTPTAMSGFTTVTGATITSSPLTVPIPASAAGTYNFNLNVRNSTTGCSSSNIPFTLTVNTPSITVSGTTSTFTTCAGTASAQQSFTVSGTSLTGNITVTPPAGYEVSLTSGSGFTSGVVLNQSAGAVTPTTVYVRLSSAATGLNAGNISCSSSGAATQGLAVSGTANPLPTMSAGSVSAISTTATAFNLPYSGTTGNPNQYSITTGSPNAMSGFTAVSNATILTSPLLVSIPASAAGTYNFNLSVRNTSTGCASTAVPFTLTVSAAPSPNIAVSGALSAFAACLGSVSSEQNFSVGGSFLAANITVTAPAGFEISTTSGSGFGSSIVLPQVTGTVPSTTIYVRTTSSASGTPSGNITCVSTGATTQNVVATATVNALPTITTSALANVSISAASFNIPYTATTGSPNQYSLVTGTPTAMTGFTPVNNVSLTTSPLVVTKPVAASGTYNFNLTVKNSTTGCASAAVPLTLTVVAPTIGIGGTVTAFATCSGTASAEQSISVSGTYLSGNITVTSPTGFEVSLTSGSGFTSSVVLNQSSGSVISTNVYLRMSSTATGAPAGNLVCSSSGATPQNVAVNGTVNAIPTFAIGTLSGVTTMATNFSIPYSALTANANQYSIFSDTPNAMIGFSSVSNAILLSSPISVTIPSSTAGTYNFRMEVRNSTTGCVSAPQRFTLTVNGLVPTLNTNGTLTPFTTCAGTVSTVKSFDVSSSYNPNTITITAPAGFEVSPMPSILFSSQVIFNHGMGGGTTTIYVRMSATANGSLFDSILVSDGTLSRYVHVEGIANAIPAVIPGSVTDVLTTATSFNLPFSTASGSPNQYSIQAGTPTAMVGFSAVNNAALTSSPIVVNIPASSAATYNFNLTVKNSTTGCASGAIPFTLKVVSAPTPSIAISGSLNDFATCSGSPSNVQMFSVGGSFLTGDITVTAPSGYEVSNSSGSGYGTTVTLSQSGGTVVSSNVYIRLVGSSSGSFNGNITCTSAGASSKTLAATGIVNVLPSITLGSVSSILNTTTSFDIPYTATSGGPTHYSLFTSVPNLMSGFDPLLNSSLSSSPIRVTIPVSDAGSYDFSMVVKNVTTGCSSSPVPFVLTINNTPPAINMSGAFTAFATCSGTASAVQGVYVSGSYLTSAITVTAPAGFEVSTSSGSGFGTSLNLIPSFGVVPQTRVFMRLSASATGNPAGALTVSTTGATTLTEPATGTVNATPVITVSPVNDIITTGTSFELSYTGLSNGDQYSLVSALPNVLPGFTSIVNAAIVSSPIKVLVPPSLAGTYSFNFTVRNSSSACVSSTQLVGLTIQNTAIVNNNIGDSQSICYGTTAAEITGENVSGGTPPLKFTWLSSTTGPASGFAPAAGTNDNKHFVPGTLTQTVWYKRVAYDAIYSDTSNVIKVEVRPLPEKPVISTQPPVPVCRGAEYLNFGAIKEPPLGVDYQWSASGALMYAQGSTKQYSLISFPDSGVARVTLTATQNGCVSYTEATYVVSGEEAADATVRYFNKNFVCEVNQVSKYQWGFDDLPTLKGNMLNGEINQNYYNVSPELSSKSYWAISSKGNCYQKSYYNAPTGMQSISATQDQLQVYPNPFEDMITISSERGISGSVIELSDMNGKVIATYKADMPQMTLSLSDLAFGVYLLHVKNDAGVVMTSKIVKY